MGFPSTVSYLSDGGKCKGEGFGRICRTIIGCRKYSPKRRRILLKARVKAFANHQRNVQDITEGRKKIVKGALE